MTPETPHVPAIPRPRFFFVAALATFLFFLVWSWLVFNVDAINAVDLRTARHWHDWSQQHHSLLSLMVFMTDLGGVPAMTLLTIMGAIWQTAIKHRFLALAWFAVILVGGLIDQSAKIMFNRDRPATELRDLYVRESNKSYPSGHSMGSAVGYGMLAYALILPQRHRPRRIVALVLLASLVAAIGFSRLFLRAHWFSDVIGGWSLGLAWVFLCVGLLEQRRLHRLQQVAPAPAPLRIETVAEQ